MFRQIDPEKLGSYDRALGLGSEYGIRLLKRYSKRNETERKEVLERLIFSYPSHDYIIDLKELIEMGFNAKKANDKERDIVNNITLELIKKTSTDIFLINQSSNGKKTNAKTK